MHKNKSAIIIFHPCIQFKIPDRNRRPKIQKHKSIIQNQWICPEALDQKSGKPSTASKNHEVP